jgi:hypothetical protein
MVGKGQLCTHKYGIQHAKDLSLASWFCGWSEELY